MLRRFSSRSEARVFVTMALAVTTLVVVVTIGSLGLVGRTFPGFVVWGDLVVASLGRTQWTGIQAAVPFRSVVTTVNGRQVSDRAALMRVVQAAPPGTRHAYGFQDRAGLQRRSIASMRFSPADWLTTLGIRVWNGVALLLTGCIVFYLKPEGPHSRAVLMLGCVGGTALVLAADLLSVGRFERLYFVFEALSVAAGVHLAVRFPERRLPGSGPLIATYSLALGVGLLEGALFHRSPDALLLLNRLVHLALAASCVAALAAVAAAAVRGQTPLVKRRARVVLGGVMLAFVAPLMPVLVFSLLGQPISLGLLALTAVIAPLALGYAVVRSDLFDADRFLSRAVVYATLALVVSLAYAGVALAARHLGFGFPVDDRAALPVTLVLAALATLSPLYDRVRRAVERRVSQDSVQRRQAVTGLSQRLAPLLHTRPIVDQVDVTLRYALGVERVGIWERTGVELVRRDRAGDGATLAGDAGVEALERIGRVVTRDEVEESASLGAERAALRALFEALDAQLVVPLGPPGGLAGLLAVGPTISGRPLSADDIDVLRTVAGVTGSALENARAVARLQSARGPGEGVVPPATSLSESFRRTTGSSCG